MQLSMFTLCRLLAQTNTLLPAKEREVGYYIICKSACQHFFQKKFIYFSIIFSIQSPCLSPLRHTKQTHVFGSTVPAPASRLVIY